MIKIQGSKSCGVKAMGSVGWLWGQGHGFSWLVVGYEFSWPSACEKVANNHNDLSKLMMTPGEASTDKCAEKMCWCRG